MCKKNDQFPLVNAHYGDCYFSRENGLAEATQVFITGNNLLQRCQNQAIFQVGETGFGTGLNLLATVRELADQKNKLDLHWWSVEKHPLAAAQISRGLAAFPELDQLLPPFLALWDRLLPQTAADGPAVSGWVHGTLPQGNLTVSLHVWIGDVVDMLVHLTEALQKITGGSSAIDAWMLDGHSPALNPDMWSQRVFGLVAGNSRAGTAPDYRDGSSLATYTAAGLVKQGLRRVGFSIVRRPGHGRKRHRIEGWYTGVALSPGAY